MSRITSPGGSLQCNRKPVLHFLSDSGLRIEFGDRRGRLVSQSAELSSALRPAVEAPGPDYEPADPDERLWLRITDLTSVLEETRTRLRSRTGT